MNHFSLLYFSNFLLNFYHHHFASFPMGLPSSSSAVKFLSLLYVSILFCLVSIIIICFIFLIHFIIIFFIILLIFCSVQDLLIR